MSAQPQSLPHSQSRVHDILCAHGRSALDYFKAASDKSIFFSSGGDSFLGYRVAGSFATVLGDPIGPEHEIPGIMKEFAAACARSGCRFALYQTLPEFLALYRQLGFRTLKLGDDAVVDLRTFTLRGGRGRSLRASLHKVERLGVSAQWYAPPLSTTVLDELQLVAEAWSRIPGRRERRFALGRFDRAYVRDTPVFVARSADGQPLAFVNIVPSYRSGEATIDLMRRTSAAVNGVMDYLLIKLLEHSRRQGFERFNLGMAPMAGFGPREKASRAERLVHFVFQRLDFVFSYRGLRAYKAKFATTWEPRYVIYRTVLDLPRLAWALANVSER